MCMVPTNPGKSWNFKKALESSGKSWSVLNFGKVLDFFCGQTVQKRDF